MEGGWDSLPVHLQYPALPTQVSQLQWEQLLGSLELAGKEGQIDDNADQQPSSVLPEHFQRQGPVCTASWMARCSVMESACDLKSQLFMILG